MTWQKLQENNSMHNLKINYFNFTELNKFNDVTLRTCWQLSTYEFQKPFVYEFMVHPYLSIVVYNIRLSAFDHLNIRKLTIL